MNEGGLVHVAREFSPRYQQHGPDAMAIDISGLERLLGPPRAIAEELRRDAADRGLRVHVAIAASWTTALVVAHARPGLTIVQPGEEAAALATVPLAVLERIATRLLPQAGPVAASASRIEDTSAERAKRVEGWGLRTLGEFAALPSKQVAARLGAAGAALQAIARGEDRFPLVPDLPEERFESAVDLEWPIEGLEPLSFVLTRLLEPLSTRLERRDRGAAVLHVALRLVTNEAHIRRLQLPVPLREVRALRTLALLDLESHPPAAAIDRVTVIVEPTPGRVLQYALFTRAQAAPEQLTTLLARLGALLGQDRFGAPALVDSYRPGAFELRPFRGCLTEPGARTDLEPLTSDLQSLTSRSAPVSALRRCRYPVPARVVMEGERPVRITTDRRGFAGGEVLHASGPWRTSGEWWADEDMEIRAQGRRELAEGRAADQGIRGRGSWYRDEWDVALSDGGMYRVFRDRLVDRWFIDAIVD